MPQRTLLLLFPVKQSHVGGLKHLQLACKMLQFSWNNINGYCFSLVCLPVYTWKEPVYVNRRYANLDIMVFEIIVETQGFSFHFLRRNRFGHTRFPSGSHDMSVISWRPHIMAHLSLQITRVCLDVHWVGALDVCSTFLSSPARSLALSLSSFSPSRRRGMPWIYSKIRLGRGSD